MTINTQDYIEVTLKPQEWSEDAVGIIEAELSDLPYNSFMEDSDADGRPVLKAYVQKSEYDARMLKTVLSGLPFRVSYSAAMVVPENWNAEWESHFEPIHIGKLVTVRAPYHKGLKRSRFNITIEPKMAFGTGHHQTTCMMMESMLEHETCFRAAKVTDLGCGTAVLAILAAKMGAAETTGIDIDAVAAQSGYDNVALNRLRKRISICCGDASLLQTESNDILLANIHRNIILQDLATYAQSLRRSGMRYANVDKRESRSDGGLLMVSGFYESDAPDIIDAASAHGLRLIGRKEREGWACLIFRRL